MSYYQFFVALMVGLVWHLFHQPQATDVVVGFLVGTVVYNLFNGRRF